MQLSKGAVLYETARHSIRKQKRISQMKDKTNGKVRRKRDEEVQKNGYNEVTNTSTNSVLHKQEDNGRVYKVRNLALINKN